MFKKYKNTDKYNFDFHLHTNYTDGRSSIREMVKKCREKGYEKIAITDHTRSSSNYFSEYFREIDELKKEFNINIYKGIEARIADFRGNLSTPKDITPEITVASVHRISINDKLYKISEFNPNIAFEIETLLSLEAVKNKKCDVIGHTGGMCITYFNDFPIENFEKIIAVCKENDVAFEINSRYHKNFIKKLAPILEKYNPYVSYGSDAHSTEEIRGIYE